MYIYIHIYNNNLSNKNINYIQFSNNYVEKG